MPAAADAAAADRIIDVSIRVAPGTPEWPGDTPYGCGWTARLADGSTVNLSAITLSPHVGTHADAPLHVRDGWPASDALPVSAFLGPAIVVDVVSSGAEVTYDALATAARAGGVDLAGAERLLLRTGRTIATGAFPDAWPWLAPACVARLCADGLVLLGIDAPSVDARDSTALATHHALFGAGAWNLENLDLRAVASGRYELVALPLSLDGLDAAPARAVLRPLR
ncbi:MAG TPA: cyclase family protein [Gemmatirosa sp.]